MKTVYNIDELNLFNFCINTSKAFNLQNKKYVLFKSFLHTFHEDGEIYEGSLEEYVAFISYMIIKDSILTNKNVLTYEQYLFSTLSGYYNHKFNKKIDGKILAKAWNNIVHIFNLILEKSSSPYYKEIHYFNTLYNSFKHLNTKVNKSTYSLDVPLIFEKEDSVDVFLILPKIKNIYYNMSLLFILNYFKNKVTNIFIIELSTKDINYTFTPLPVTNTLLNQYKKQYDSLYIDFNKISYSNCNVCPLTCNRTELLETRYIETPFSNRNKTIKTRNI